MMDQVLVIRRFLCQIACPKATSTNCVVIDVEPRHPTMGR
ncbi:hypothetical protein U716_10580 [Rhodobacter capsulatus B6]|nr:hypothetical protein U716_10580 [Rhodobacter capsulatus B6]